MKQKYLPLNTTHNNLHREKDNLTFTIEDQENDDQTLYFPQDANGTSLSMEEDRGLELKTFKHDASTINASNPLEATLLDQINHLTHKYNQLREYFSNLRLFVLLLALFFFIMLAMKLFFLMPSHDNGYQNIHTIAFGSCTSYDLRPWDIFTTAIIPSKPDMWIWTGDFVYLDDNEVNCAIFEDSSLWQQSCNCSANWLDSPPYSCHAGDIEYASDRWIKGLRNEPYQQFIDYMCPNSIEHGQYPPDGSDPSICPKPIFGIYDDHDFGWNNGNQREPQKRMFKDLYLDAIGESRESIRRNAHRGAFTKYTINKGVPKKQFDVILLDERYERSTLPCDTRREYCQQIVLHPNATKIGSSEKKWCQDFLSSGGVDDHGSCCQWDELIYFTWCQRSSSKKHPLYRDVCDITYENFGMKSLRYNSLTEDIEEITADSNPFTSNNPLDQSQTPLFCDVLGKEQRKWLKHVIQSSTSDLKLIVSGSVLMYNPSPYTCGVSPSGQNVTCRCGGDNIDCYRVAQQELFHIIGNLSTGCNIILTGDYHFSDIKAMHHGSNTKYASFDLYNTQNMIQPTLYQLMASGLTSSTGKDFVCEDFRLDPMGLRTHAECNIVTGPNFGRVILEYHDMDQSIKTIKLQILSGIQSNHILLEYVIDAKKCMKTNKNS